MRRGVPVWLLIGLLIILSVVLNGNDDPEAWAALFWLSAMANVVLLMMVISRR